MSVPTDAGLWSLTDSSRKLTQGICLPSKVFFKAGLLGTLEEMRDDRLAKLSDHPDVGRVQRVPHACGIPEDGAERRSSGVCAQI